MNGNLRLTALLYRPISAVRDHMPVHQIALIKQAGRVEASLPSPSSAHAGLRDRGSLVPVSCGKCNVFKQYPLGSARLAPRSGFTILGVFRPTSSTGRGGHSYLGAPALTAWQMVMRVHLPTAKQPWASVLPASRMSLGACSPAIPGDGIVRGRSFLYGHSSDPLNTDRALGCVASLDGMEIFSQAVSSRVVGELVSIPLSELECDESQPNC
ncbi:uncharacterized protein VTP21DRAFT_8102 [Calcarisporiella thermophila]|uniref:uncharacterized protein n=1 Tax=Calcarisporiella thermophila TaxID=911321 RepID=UPI00374480F5